MAEKKNQGAEYEIKSFGDLIKALFKYDNWYIGGFVVLLILFVIFDIIAFTPHH